MGKNEINPYLDKGNIRTFSKDVDPMELVWHQDDEDRTIEILEGKGWCIQRDNMLPRAMKKGETIFITKGEVHRILKGTTDLKIKING
jgi:quercetin dioxygenase-like cupin family protein